MIESICTVVPITMACGVTVYRASRYARRQLSLSSGKAIVAAIAITVTRFFAVALVLLGSALVVKVFFLRFDLGERTHGILIFVISVPVLVYGQRKVNAFLQSAFSTPDDLSTSNKE
jgi:hypothetical protein